MGGRAELSKACIIAYGSKGGLGHYVGGINYGGRSGGYFRFYNAKTTASVKKCRYPITFVYLTKKVKHL